MLFPSTTSVVPHKIILCGAFILFSAVTHAQVVGGRGNSESTPTTVKPADLAGSSYGGDVNLFNGTYNGSYTLGTVATPGGLSYTLSLNYSSVIAGGHNAPVATGIPYGEGWNLSIPSVSISSEAYKSYSDILSCNYKNAIVSTTVADTHVTSFFYSLPYNNDDGDVFWYAPYISVPGVASGRAVFKYFSEGSPVFVLQHFEQYVELIFRGGSWDILLQDGTVYEFALAQNSFRNASNRRAFNYHSEELEDFDLAESIEKKIENTILPKEETLHWYCTRIYNKNHLHTQQIDFSYQKFGAFNYFNELMFNYQPAVSAMLLGEAATENDPKKFITYSDILLTEVSSRDNYTPIDRIKLNYNTILAGGAQDMLMVGQQGVKRLDSLYNYKSVFYEGDYQADTANCDISPGGPTADGTSYIPAACNRNDFNGWKRFLHAAHNDVPGTPAFSNPLNPYIYNFGSVGNYYYNEIYGPTIPFNHGFLESPRIGGPATDPQGTERLVPGDIYEIRTVVSSDATNAAQGFCNLDINIATGSNYPFNAQPKDSFIFPGQDTLKRVESGFKDITLKETIFSTFNQAVKWNLKGRGFSKSAVIVTSNFFAMPYVSHLNDGFNIQIGPANSDNYFSANEYTALFDKSADKSITPPSAFYTYVRPLSIYNGYAANAEPKPLNIKLFRASDPAPSNFGVGLPWYQMRHLYSNLQQSSIKPGADADMFKFWWKKDTLFPGSIFPNIPTLADENTRLKAVELIRYSKNPYMLTSVDIYKTNGEINGTTDPGKMLVKRMELDYRVISSRRVAEHAIPVYTHYWKNSFLLHSVKTIPVDPSNQTPPALAATQKALLPSVHFLYDTLANNFFFYPEKRQSVAGVALKKIINHLGGVTQIEYYPDTIGYVSGRYRTYSPCVTVDELTALSRGMNATQVHYPVKAVKVSDNSGNVQQRDYSYGVKKKTFKGESVTLNKDHFTQHFYVEQYGFDTTVVLEPEINGQRSKTIYIHYCDTASSAFFGKLKRVERYDGSNQLLNKEESFYDRLMAYRNGANRLPHLLTSLEYDYQDYHDFEGMTDTSGLAGAFSLLRISSFSGGESMKFYETPKFLNVQYLDTVKVGEQSYNIVSVRPDTTLDNSYFIKKIKGLNTDYELGCVIDPNDTATGGGGFDNKAQNPDKNQVISIINNDPNQDAIEQVLMMKSPLEDAILKAMLNRQPSMDEDRIKKVLMHQPDLSDEVMKEMLHRQKPLSDATLKEVISPIPHHLSESVHLEMAHRTPAVGNDALKEVAVKHSPLTDNVLKEHINRSSFADWELKEILLEQRHLSDEVLKRLMERDPSPNEEMLKAVLLKQPDISEEVMQGVEARKPPMDDSLKAELRRRTVARGLNDLTQACNAEAATSVLAIARITDYEWFDAEFNGFTTSRGFRHLMNVVVCDSIELKFEPSWQLYRKNTYSPQYPSAFSQQEYFYYYDLLNRYNNHCLPAGKKGNPIGITDPNNPLEPDPKDTSFIPQLRYFCGVKTALNANLRNIAFEQRNTSKNAADNNALVRSSYFIYDCDWNEFQEYSVETENTGGPPCPTVDPGTDSATAIANICIECKDAFFTDSAWKCLAYTFGWITQEEIPPGYAMYMIMTAGSSEPIFMICPLGTFNASDPDITIVYSNGFAVFPDALGGRVERKLNFFYDFQLYHRATYDQMDTLPLLNYGGPFGVVHTEQPLLDFAAIRDPGHLGRSLWFPSFPYDALQVYKVNERNEYGQVQLDEDAKGLQTRYYYAPKTVKFLVDTVCFHQSHEGAVNPNIGLPVAVTQGVGNNDSLTTFLEYYPDNSIKKITDPNGMQLKYDYDIFGRLQESFRNRIRTQMNRYHTWENDTSQNFSQRISQNYVETFIFNNDNDSAAEHTRAYLDPLGREHNTVSILTSNAFLPFADSSDNIVHTGEIIYDTWNRKAKSYKPFVFDSSGFKLGIIPRLHSVNTTQYPDAFSTATYENSYRSRKLREAKPGQDINTGKVVKYRYEHLNFLCFLCELGLTMNEVGELMPGDPSEYIFLKTETEDEDKKITAEYSNALGQKVATRQVASNAQQSVTLFYYDSYGNLARTVNPEKQESNYDYNILGWMYRKKNPDGGISKYMYNKEGKVSLEQDANGARGAYLTNGDSVPYFRQYLYDNFGRMIKQQRSVFPLCSDYINPLLFEGKPADADNLQGNGCEWFYSMSNNATYDWKTGLQAVAGSGTGNDPLRIVNISLADISFNSALEKEWYYNLAGIDQTTLHDNAAFFTNNARTFMKGRLSHTLACGNGPIDLALTETRKPVKFCFYSYNADGETSWQMQQFNHGGITAMRKGLLVRLDYPEYNTRGSLLNEVADVNSDMTPDMAYQYVYDGRNRLKEVYAGFTDSVHLNDLLASYNYNDALGLVKKTTYHRDCNAGTGSNYAVDSITYSYDVRDRLTNIGSRLFDYQLFYDNVVPFYYACPLGDRNWNGNINGTIATWKLSGTNNNPGNFAEPTYFGYSYDGLNRLTAADGILDDLSQPPHCRGDISIGDEEMEYDRVGNILNLKRYLPPQAGTNPVAEEWDFSYFKFTNRLKKAIGRNGTVSRTYSYDAAGNVIRDSYRDLDNGLYGRANLPFSIKANDVIAGYLYDQNDQRVYKETAPMVGSAQFASVGSAEFYLRDMAGNEIGILDMKTGQWSWYGFGRERFARLMPVTNQQAEFFAKDNGTGIDNAGALEQKIKNELKDHTIIKGRSFPEKLMEVQWTSGSNSGTKEIITQTRLNEKVQMKPSLKYTTLQEAQIETDRQMLAIKETTQPEKRMSAKELIDAPVTQTQLQRSGNIPVNSLDSNGNFVIPPYSYFTNKTLGNLTYYIFDHLGNTRVTYKPNVNCNGGGISYTLESVIDLYPYSKILREYRAGVQEKYISTGNERDIETGYDNRNARSSDPDNGRFNQMDRLAHLRPEWSPYRYGFCNPVNFGDPTGLYESTHTDKEGNVLAVYDDGDLGVYKHDISKEDYKAENDIIPGGGNSLRPKDGEKVGETEYWDEFRAHDNKTGEVLPNVQAGAKIVFGESWDGIISLLNGQAQGMDLKEIANNSRSNQLFDIKTNNAYAPFGPGTGKSLDGKYATARSAGNYLAGLNAQGGTYFGAGISQTTFMKMAGALHTGNWSNANAAGIILKGTSYGPAPYYGEIPYAGRMIEKGWNTGAK